MTFKILVDVCNDAHGLLPSEVSLVPRPLTDQPFQNFMVAPTPCNSPHPAFCKTKGAWVNALVGISCLSAWFKQIARPTTKH